MADSYDYLLKFLIIGAAGTGKSCLLHRFIESKCTSLREYSSHTIGVEFASRMVTVDLRAVKLQIWDTAGQERFRSVTRSYYRGAAAALLVFDVTCRESFDAVSTWLHDARNLGSPNIVVALVGHKSDLEAQRKIGEAEARLFAEQNEMPYIEASALSGHNVDEVFLQCARRVLELVDKGVVGTERTSTTNSSGISSGVQLGRRSSAAALRRGNNVNVTSRPGTPWGSSASSSYQSSNEQDQCQC